MEIHGIGNTKYKLLTRYCFAALLVALSFTPPLVDVQLLHTLQEIMCVDTTPCDVVIMMAQEGVTTQHTQSHTHNHTHTHTYGHTRTEGSTRALSIHSTKNATYV